MSSRKLNHNIQSATTPSQALETLLKAQRGVNGANVACALTTTAKLLSRGGRGLADRSTRSFPPGLAALLTQTVALCEVGLGMEGDDPWPKGGNRFRPRSISNAVWGLAKCSDLLGGGR